MKLIFIKWGKGYRRYKVKNFSLYEKIGKIGRFNLYQRKKKIKKKAVKKKVIKKKLVQKKKKIISRHTEQLKKVKTTRKEREFIKKIKGKGAYVSLAEEKRIEKDLLKRVQLLPKFDKYKYVGKINPEHKIISNGKVYGNFHAFDNDKRDIYLGLMGNLFESKNQKFKDKLYSLRDKILKDGIVIEVDVYGILHEKNVRKKYFGTLALVGLMIENAGFVESDLIGWSGENRLIEHIFDSMTRNAGGEKCYWIRNNLTLDTIHVTITDVQLRLNYS